MRQQDSDRFLCALMAPVAGREKLFTLLAFNQEIAKIRSVVSEPVLGQIRLQWWQEAIEAKTSPAHEVAQPLGALLASETGLRRLLIELLDARERDLSDDPFSLAELTAYAKATSAPLLRAMGEEADDIATGYALVGILRAIPAEWAAGRCRLLSGLQREALGPAVRQVAGEATRLLSGPARGQARFWQAVARLYLKQLLKADYEVWDIRFQLPHPWRGAALLWASLTG